MWRVCFQQKYITVIDTLDALLLSLALGTSLQFGQIACYVGGRHGGKDQ